MNILIIAILVAMVLFVFFKTGSFLWCVIIIASTFLLPGAWGYIVPFIELVLAMFIPLP